MRVPQQQYTVAMPPPPARPRTGLFVGLGGGAVAVIAGIVFLFMQQSEESRRAAERAAHLVAERVAEESRKAAEKGEANAKVFFSVVSDPLGAMVEATWKNGAKAGVTPLELEAPKNVKVRFAFSKRDYLPYAEERIADAAQVVKATLQVEPRVVAARPVPESKKRERRSTRAAQPPAQQSADDSIPVEF
jgi:hypothetical protein